MLGISGLNFYYGESHILRSIDMTVAPGQMVCLIGRNGVGKTTLLRNILGLLKPRTGTMTMAGAPITRKTPDQRARMGIGYVPQGREIIPGLTVKENLILGLEARPKKKGKATIPTLVFELFPVLKTMLERMGGDLSGGTPSTLVHITLIHHTKR